MEWQRLVAEMKEIDGRIENWNFDDHEMSGEWPRQSGPLGCFDQLKGWRVRLIAL